MLNLFAKQNDDFIRRLVDIQGKSENLINSPSIFARSLAARVARIKMPAERTLSLTILNRAFFSSQQLRWAIFQSNGSRAARHQQTISHKKSYKKWFTNSIDMKRERFPYMGWIGSVGQWSKSACWKFWLIGSEVSDNCRWSLTIDWELLDRIGTKICCLLLKYELEQC